MPDKRRSPARRGATPEEACPHQLHSPTRTRPIVAVIGDGVHEATERAAYEVGRELARAGVHLMCGGLGGCMAGAARGYREGGGDGVVVGLLPGDSHEEANPWVDLALPTGINEAQCALIAMAAQGAVVVGGGGGTLSEVGLLMRENKPIVALPRSGGAASIVAGRELGQAKVRTARQPKAAVRLLLREMRARGAVLQPRAAAAR